MVSGTLLGCVVAAVGMGDIRAMEERVFAFSFAPVGASYSGIIHAENPMVGRRITLARVLLSVWIEEGSDGAGFETGIFLPILTDAPWGNVLTISGSALEWSGAGLFVYEHETTEFNGEFIAVTYGAGTLGKGYSGEILSGSRVEFVTVPAPGASWLAGAVVGAGILRRRRAGVGAG